jgi:hypothetical protein
METLITTLRWLHIAAGTIALFVAPAAMLTVKGGRAHRRWGKIYFWAMAVVAATAVALGLWRPRIFLTLLAVFSFYLAFSGYRALWRKRPMQGQGPRPIDWAAALLTLAVGGALVVFGVLQPGPTWERLGIVPVVFGALGMVLSGLDLWKFVRPPTDRNAWWFAHMAGMLGSYIATVSAFSVVNFDFLPITVRWLWATVIGTPLIAIWITYHKRRFRRHAHAPVGATRAGEISC